MKRYLVKLVRPVIEATVIEVDADDEETAMLSAVERAADLPESSWEDISSPDDYSYHAVEVRQPDQEDSEDEEDFLFEDRFKFLLLQADTEAVEGRLLMHPWISKLPGLDMADLSTDWADQVGDLQVAGKDSFMRDLQDLAPENVIPFARLEALRAIRKKQMGEADDE